MVVFGKPRLNGGFSLLELLVVIAILGILMKIAWLPFREMMANQRLRSVTSDLVADLALARVEAIKRSSRVGVARTAAAGWEDGWQVFDDANRDGKCQTGTSGGVCDAAGGEAVLVSRPALNTTVKVCSADATFTVLTFGADGTVRAYDGDPPPLGAIPRITVSSTFDSPGVPARQLEFSPSGRVTVVSTGVAACP